MSVFKVGNRCCCEVEWNVPAAWRCQSLILVGEVSLLSDVELTRWNVADMDHWITSLELPSSERSFKVKVGVSNVVHDECECIDEMLRVDGLELTKKRKKIIINCETGCDDI